jgi:hypothetical protein
MVQLPPAATGKPSVTFKLFLQNRKRCLRVAACRFPQVLKILQDFFILSSLPKNSFSEGKVFVHEIGSTIRCVPEGKRQMLGIENAKFCKISTLQNSDPFFFLVSLSSKCSAINGKKIFCFPMHFRS